MSVEMVACGVTQPRSGFLRHDCSKSQERWANGGSDDREDDGDDKEPDNDAEYSLGWENEGSQGRLDTTDWEADLGTTEETDQMRRLEAAPTWAADTEPNLGWAENFGKGVVGSQNCLDDREHEDEREDDPAEHGIADPDAMVSEEFMFGGWPGDGSGVTIARNLLRKANGQLPLVEKAGKLPDDTIIRRFEPLDDDVVMIPESDLRAHALALKGHLPCTH